MLRRKERERLARQAYARAVAQARKHPTSATWRRLLRAAQNLREAVAEMGLRPVQDAGR